VEGVAGVWQRLLAAYHPDKRRWDRIYPWIGYVLRPVSFVLSAPLGWLGVTADQVTALTAVLGVLACVLLSLGTWPGFVWGGLAITALNLFDCVDGNLARLRSRPGPPRGKFYDQLVGYFFPLSYFFLGLGLARAHPAEALALVAAGAAATLARVLVSAVRLEFGSVLAPAWQHARESGRVSRAGHAHRWYARGYHNVTELSGHDFLLWGAALGGWLPYFLAASAAIALLDLVFTVAFHVARAARL
jgi:phosphatidylglycerophosphate synthase